MSMDTIIYFYKKRGLQEPEAEPVGLKAYMLVRVAMDVGPREWFGQSLDEGVGPRGPRGAGSDDEGRDNALEDGLSAEDADAPRPGLREVLAHPLRALLRRRLAGKRRRQAQERLCREREEQARMAARRQELLRTIEADMGRLKAEIMEYTGQGEENCFCAYDDAVRKALIRREGEGDLREGRGGIAHGQDMEEGTLASMWGEYFPLPEFKGYGRLFWARRLLPRARLPHFVILGVSPDIRPIIEGLARRMKSLRWILLEEECSQELKDFVEDFYVEYGLAVTLQPLGEGEAYRRLRLVCPMPVNVLDFTMEPHIFAGGLAEGSIWLDMMSVEEKGRRTAGRGKGVVYYSLKEEWRRAQKRCNCPIVP